VTAAELQTDINSLILLEVEIDKIPFSQRGVRIIRAVIAQRVAERQAAEWREGSKKEVMFNARSSKGNT
jgi:hypothetical protein